MSVNWEAEAQAAAGPTDEQLQQIANLAQSQVEAEALVEYRKQQLKEAEESLRNISEERLPDAIAACGLESFTLQDGTKISVRSEVYANISKANWAAAETWLREHGHAPIIRSEFKVAFGADEDDAADKFQHELDTEGVEATRRKFVHHSTLRAFVAEELKKGSGIPTDVFGVFEKRVSKVERKK
jgi:hypothetical protein